MDITLRIKTSSGLFPVTALRKTGEICIAPFVADLNFEFPPMPVAVDSFSVEAYRGYSPAPDARTIYSGNVPGTATQFSMRIDLEDTKDFTLRITTHKSGNAPSYIIIEDVIK